jgi:hypothetical protein
VGYNVRLVNAETGETVKVDKHTEGGQYAIGGSEEADLYVTYNYSEIYRLVNFHLRDLEGCCGSDSVEILERVVEKLGTKRFEDYWAPTLGNAGYAASVLLSWARLYPDAVWKVD